MPQPPAPRRMPALAPLALYLALHALLDWISFFHEVPPLNITPWNPPAGLMMGVAAIAGLRAAPLLWLGLTAADAVVRDLPVSLAPWTLWATVLGNAVVASGYGAAGWLLRRRLGMAPTLDRLRDVMLLLAVAAAAALLVGAGYVGLHTLAGLFPWSRFPEVLLRYWTGEVIGIAVLTPVVLIGLRRPASRWLRLLGGGWGRAAEVAVPAVLIATVLWLDFGPLASAQYEHFYLLFLPVIGVAVRHGLPGAALASAVTQAGLIVAIQVTGVETDRMAYFQLLMLTLAVTALLLGAVVSERRRAEAWLRERQADLAHASRLTEAGAMAAALAHELNQPLSAAMSYARAARKIARLDGASPRLADILDKTVAQAERADRVIRSLREFVRKGGGDRAALPVAGLVADCLTLAAPVAGQHAARLTAEVSPGLPPIRGDAVQLQQALLNLVRNAAEAMSGAAGGGAADAAHDPASPAAPLRGRIVVFARPAEEAGFVALGVRDTGPGLAEVVERNLFTPFVTTKATGMGLGLAIVRGIVEVHGGTLSAGAAPGGGTVVQFTIPVDAATGAPASPTEGDPA